MLSSGAARNLEVLNLRGNRIGPIGATHLAEAVEGGAADPSSELLAYHPFSWFAEGAAPTP